MIKTRQSDSVTHWRRLAFPLAAAWLLGMSGPVAAGTSVTSTFVAAPDPSYPVCSDTDCFSQPSADPDQYWGSENKCKSMGTRLPTKDELLALYAAYPNNQMATLFGWRTDGGYWTSEICSSRPSSTHCTVSLRDGSVVSYTNTSWTLSTCVRAK